MGRFEYRHSHLEGPPIYASIHCPSPAGGTSPRHVAAFDRLEARNVAEGLHATMCAGFGSAPDVIHTRGRTVSMAQFIEGNEPAGCDVPEPKWTASRRTRFAMVLGKASCKHIYNRQRGRHTDLQSAHVRRGIPPLPLVAVARVDVVVAGRLIPNPPLPVVVPPRGIPRVLGVGAAELQ